MFQEIRHFFSRSPLFAPIEPYNTGFLPVESGHELHYEESGNPNGQPVVCLHGGPGACSKPKHRQFFCPKKYRIILFDQRGCGKSTYEEQLRDNTTQHLVADIETLRAHLNIKKWHVFGGSWGSALALAYGQAHPNKVKSIMVHSVFLVNPFAQGWHIKKGQDILFPDAYEVFIKEVKALGGSEENPHQIIASAIQGDNIENQRKASFIFSRWHLEGMSPRWLAVAPPKTDEEWQALVNMHKLFFHYEQNGFFMQENALLKKTPLLTMPVSIVHGRLDFCCPLLLAWQLHKAIPHSTLGIVEGEGHRVLHSSKLAKEVIKMTNDHFFSKKVKKE